MHDVTMHGVYGVQMSLEVAIALHRRFVSTQTRPGVRML